MLRSYSLFSPWTFKKSLPVELFDFFESLAINPPTKSAFVQARDKIRPLFFQDLFRLSTKLFYRHFSVQNKNQHSTVPSTRILCFFDVLKQLIPDIYLHPRQFAKRTTLRLLSATEPVRKKNRTRKRRIMRGTERHIYESNYRPTI